VAGSKAKEKEARLRGILEEMGSCLIAFSGGVDSAYLALIAHEELGQKALAVTAESPSYPAYQKKMVLDIVDRYAMGHEFIRTAELEDPNYADNPTNRCYFCKHELYTKLRVIAMQRGFFCVSDGNNVDDTGDYRPGREAAEKLAVRSPLIEAGLNKAEIRALSKDRGLPTWNLPASACLSSRLPYGSPVTEKKLRMIEDGESILRSLGFRQIRVRHHDEIARIEIAQEELEQALSLDVFRALAERFKEIGFKFVTLDVEAYRTGRLNEPLVSLSGLEDPEK
jgi:uncharacterized protein